MTNLSSYIRWHKDNGVLIVTESSVDQEDNDRPLLVVPLYALSAPVALLGIQMGYEVVSPSHYRGEWGPPGHSHINQTCLDYARGHVKSVTLHGTDEDGNAVSKAFETANYNNDESFQRPLFVKGSFINRIDVQISITDPRSPERNGESVIGTGHYAYEHDGIVNVCAVKGLKFHDQTVTDMVALVSSIRLYHEVSLDGRLDEMDLVDDIYFAERAEQTLTGQLNGPAKVRGVMKMFGITKESLRSYIGAEQVALKVDADYVRSIAGDSYPEISDEQMAGILRDLSARLTNHISQGLAAHTMSAVQSAIPKP